MSTDECECYDKCSKQRCRGSHWLQAWQAQQQRLLTQLPIQHKVSLSMVVVLLLVAVFTLRSLQLETWRGRQVQQGADSSSCCVAAAGVVPDCPPTACHTSSISSMAWCGGVVWCGMLSL